MRNDIQGLKEFYDSLTNEKETFTLPFSSMVRHKLIITEENMGKIVGVAGITKDNSLFVAVESEYQNQKIGQELVKKVVKKAIERNFSYISLSVFEQNAKAIHIFSKLGFKTVHASTRNQRRFLVMVLPFNRRGVCYKGLLSIALMVLSAIRR